MPDYGLLGLGSALEKGTEGYLAGRKLKKEDEAQAAASALAKKQYDATLFKEDAQENVDPNTGEYKGLVESELGKQKREAKNQQNKGLLAAKGVEGFDADTGAPILSQKPGSEYQQERLEIMRGNQDLRAQQQAGTVSSRIHSKVQPLTNQINLMQGTQQILAKPTLTNQEFNDAQQELSNAIAGARSSAIGKLQRTEYDSAQQELNGLLQKITGSPRDSVPKEIVARVQQLASETADRMKNQRYDTAKRLSVPYGHPLLQQTQNEAIEGYNPAAETKAPPQGMLPPSKVINGTTYVKAPGGWAPVGGK